MWFESLTGFAETSGAEVRARIREDGPFLESTANGRRMRRGEFTMQDLAGLRLSLDRDQVGPGTGPASVQEVVADVRELHADPASAGATFQVASQFNMLEMISPDVTPEQGIDRYDQDPTQGPACATACGAGTLHRSYFVPMASDPHSADVVRGQTAGRQLDGLSELAAALDLTVDMRNGYAFVSQAELVTVGERLNRMSRRQRDEVAGLLRVGVQTGSEVTWRDAGHTVTQVFCSALPIAYAGGPLPLWEPLARLVLESAYEATISVAATVAAGGGSPTVYLTLLGAGVFGNPVSWVLDALQRSLDLPAATGLEVRVVSHGRPNPALAPLLSS